MSRKPITVVETHAFERRVTKLLSETERAQLLEFLAYNPDSGDGIEGTGGIRKVRFAAKGKGKSGGVRVIYYYYNASIPLYALLIYGKNEQGDLTSNQRTTLTKLAAMLKAGAKGTIR